MIARLCLLAVTVLAVGLVASTATSRPASACEHHAKYDGA